MDPQRTFGISPWVRRLLVANLIVFLCQKTILVDPRFQAVLGFDPLYALARPWTFLTYMFLHADILHLAFNLLALFMFGPPVEERMGGRAFLTYYVVCGLGGAALSFALMQVRYVGVVLGASAAVYGVMLAFAWAWPDQPIYVFPFPAPIRAKWLVTFAVGISFLLALFSVSDGVAHLAHLGGFGAGFVYLKASAWWLARAERQVRRVTEPGVLVQSARAAGSGDAAPNRRPPPGGERDAKHAEVDRVLDKISAEGIESLTPAERRFLAELSRKMRDKS
jgi:membrane associated rhomboid family serine protease